MLLPRIARLRLARLHPDADAAHTARGFHELAKSDRLAKARSQQRG